MGDAIRVKGVTKTFGTKVAVRDLDLSVPRGSLCGFIGPNGAGKTTSIRMIMSILFPDRGEISVLGHRSALEAKDRIGYLPEERGVYKKMKVAAFLKHIGRLKGVEDAGMDRKIDRWLERVGLREVRGKKCEELSKGMQQKIQFVATVLPEPDLLILDEPFSGLDPINMRLLQELIDEQRQRGATILFSTHVMYQAEQLCDRVIMINDGTKVLDASMGEIRRRFDPRVILFEPMDGGDSAGLAALPGIERVEPGDKEWRVFLDEDCRPASAIQEMVQRIAPARVELQRPTLEDIFIQIVTETSPASVQQIRDLRAALSNEAAPVKEVAS
jgi:ABC-2 type transport system ATP-binding protein